MEFDKTLKVGLLLVQPEPSAPASGLVKAELAVGFVEGGAPGATVEQFPVLKQVVHAIGIVAIVFALKLYAYS